MVISGRKRWTGRSLNHGQLYLLTIFCQSKGISQAMNCFQKCVALHCALHHAVSKHDLYIVCNALWTIFFLCKHWNSLQCCPIIPQLLESIYTIYRCEIHRHWGFHWVPKCLYHQTLAVHQHRLVFCIAYSTSYGSISFKQYFHKSCLTYHLTNQFVCLLKPTKFFTPSDYT